MMYINIAIIICIIVWLIADLTKPGRSRERKEKSIQKNTKEK